jgi:hypothetical protein
MSSASKRCDVFSVLLTNLRGKQAMRTFPVSSVQSATKLLPPLNPTLAFRSLLHAPIEQWHYSTTPLVICTTQHPLAAAAYQAFYDHRPLVLTPDLIWFCLAQGFAQHVNLHAEQLRERFVSFSEKLTLIVTRPDFILGQLNPWPEVFSSFSDQIASHVGRLRNLIVPDFSTTGLVERAACEVLLMDTFQPYFKYEVRAGCGIPWITLLGTPDDWYSVRQRALMLSEFGLKEWIAALQPILDQLIATAEGQIDLAFWRSFFRYESGSMGAEMTGWIQVLFPYLIHHERPDRSTMPALLAAEEALGDELARRLAGAVTDEEHADITADIELRIEALFTGSRSLILNPYMFDWETKLQTALARTEWLSWNNTQGPHLNELPSGIASAPLRWVDLRDGTETQLRLVVGLFGVAQQAETGALQPEFGWAVIHDRAA